MTWRKEDTAVAVGVALCGALLLAATWAYSDPEPVTVPVPGPTTYVPAPYPVPGPTVTKTAKPKPAPTVTVTARAEPVSRSSRGSWALGEWGRFPAYVEAKALCVAKHESWTSGLWTAENPISTASGAFQFVDDTWRAYTKRAEIPFTSHASLSPPRDQAKAFAWAAMNNQGFHWAGAGCF